MTAELDVAPLTCRQIQLALFVTYDKGDAIIVPNCCMLPWEADLLVMRKTGYIAEFEIKVSRADFKADFRKKEKHYQLAEGYQHGPNEFYYCCEQGLIKPEEVPAYAGLAYVVNCWYEWPVGNRYMKREVRIEKKAPRLHNHSHAGLERKLAISLMRKAFVNHAR